MNQAYPTTEKDRGESNLLDEIAQSPSKPRISPKKQQNHTCKNGAFSPSLWCVMRAILAVYHAHTTFHNLQSGVQMPSNLRWHPGIPQPSPGRSSEDDPPPAPGPPLPESALASEEEGALREQPPAHSAQATVSDRPPQETPPTGTRTPGQTNSVDPKIAIPAAIGQFTQILTRKQLKKKHHRGSNRLGLPQNSRRQKDVRRRRPTRDSNGVIIANTPELRKLQSIMALKETKKALKKQRSQSKDTSA